MFRKPRDESQVKITGRPPSPSPLAKTPFTLAVPPSVPPPSSNKMAIKSSRPSAIPTIGRQGPTGSAKKKSPGGKPNGNILSFFKRAEDESIFVEERGGGSGINQKSDLNGSPEFRRSSQDVPNRDEDDAKGEEEVERFNESGGSVKRRKTASEKSSDLVEESGNFVKTQGEHLDRQDTSARKSGPFFEDSDSEHDDEQPEAIINIKEESVNPEETMEPVPPILPAEDTRRLNCETGGLEANPSTNSNIQKIPALIKEETSVDMGMAEFGDFEGMEDFDEDLYEDGDEYVERRYMEEQAQLEADENEKDYDHLPGQDTSITESGLANVGDGPPCPICGLGLAGVTEQEAAVHVNNCLDGNPSPLPEQKTREVHPSPEVKTEPPDTETRGTPSASQYRRPFRPPKPGQPSPFLFGQSKGTTSGGSAFNKLMSGHSEEAAWAEAAASENASRGKPSYQRTCPFYKILPGLFICVDAFRYGAVQGCSAYFLSHFHSDHYVGLTSSWSHGPIFCSKVTGNLVRQQLRVDAQYVVALEWEEKVEVPNTNGVYVTMISANHCPGSSLFLFEKAVGKNNDGSSKLQRILHCGDFRACRMHVEHPLLKPEIQNAISGGTKEQKINVCYLDTTYLNPKYAFPSQEAVTKACADMCVSLSKCKLDENDGWEQMKRQRAGEGMAKFVQRENSIKSEPQDDNEDDRSSKDDMKVERNPHRHASQQILSSDSSVNGRGRLLVVVGTYSIGKERICLGIAKALDSMIYAPPSKQRIVAALEDPELDCRMTNDPRKAQVHMTPLFEIRADTLDDYLKDYFPHFTRAVGFRPSGWNYRPPNSRFTDSPSVQTVLYSDNWRSAYSMKDLVPQRGSTSRSSCFGVPYSEHSSFRELTMFCTALKIDKIIPTVNVGSAKSRERMKAWCERWGAERRKNGLYKLPDDGSF